MNILKIFAYSCRMNAWNFAWLETQAWDNYDFSDAIIIKAIVYLFFWSCTSHTRIFHSYGDVTITSEWIKTLTNTRSH